MDIKRLLREAQDGQVFANLARAFHLPPEKVEVAVDVILHDLIARIERNTLSRHPLAGLVELLGQSAYEQVLDTPTLVGATHTQVIGNEALNILAGRGENDRMAQHAAAAAAISPMIAEYLLPAVAVLLVGTLARVSRSGLESIMSLAPGGAPPTAAANESGHEPQHLPRVAGGVGFSGSTGGSVTLADAPTSSYYLELAESIRRADGTPGTPDPAIGVRRVLASSLGFATGPLGWVSRMQRWGMDAVKAALAGWRR